MPSRFFTGGMTRMTQEVPECSVCFDTGIVTVPDEDGSPIEYACNACPRGEEVEENMKILGHDVEEGGML